MSLSKNLAFACLIDSCLLEVWPVFSDSLLSDNWVGEELFPFGTWLDDDGLCITVLSVSSDLVTLLFGELISPGSVLIGESLFSSIIDFESKTVPLFDFEVSFDSISSSCLSGVVSQMLLSLMSASSTGDLAISC